MHDFNKYSLFWYKDVLLMKWMNWLIKFWLFVCCDHYLEFWKSESNFVLHSFCSVRSNDPHLVDCLKRVKLCENDYMSLECVTSQRTLCYSHIGILMSPPELCNVTLVLILYRGHVPPIVSLLRNPIIL